MDGGLEAKPPVQARSPEIRNGRAVMGIWGRRLRPPEANGGLENFAFFCKINLILKLF